MNDVFGLYSDNNIINHYSQFNTLFKKEIKIFNELNEIIGENIEKKVLDIGCGAGRTTEPLHSMGFKVTGIDLSEKMILTARKKNPEIDYQIADITTYYFPENQFDYVLFSFNGIDYIYPYSKRLKVIKNIYTTLKPGGIFIYSSHNSTCFLTTRKSRLINLFYNTIQLRIFSNYRKNNNAKEGEIFLFHQTPLTQKKILSKVGFSNIRIISDYKSMIKTMFCDYWPYYLALKPYIDS